MSEENIPNKRPKICLNMIVKNEVEVIPRVLMSVLPHIDCYAIVDTGSTDGTQQLIRDFMSTNNIPGNVYDEAWVNFSVGRNQALNYAILETDADFVLIIDADEEFVSTGLDIHDLIAPGYVYLVTKRFNTVEYKVPNIVDIRNYYWEWAGAVHESLNITLMDQTRIVEFLGGYIHCNPDGSRSKEVSQRDKFLNDVKLLQEDLKVDPYNTRTLYYIAQSYYDAGDFSKAAAAFKKRIERTGFDQEDFIARYRLGQTAIMLGLDIHTTINLLLDAYAFRPTRAEALFTLSNYLRSIGEFAKAYVFSKVILDIDSTDDILFVEQDMYGWKKYDLHAMNAFYSGHSEEYLKTSLRLLEMDIPDNVKQVYADNLLKTHNLKITFPDKEELKE